MNLVILGFSVLLAGIISISMYYDERNVKKFNKLTRTLALLPITVFLVSTIAYLSFLIFNFVNFITELLN